MHQPMLLDHSAKFSAVYICQHFQKCWTSYRSISNGNERSRKRLGSLADRLVRNHGSSLGPWSSSLRQDPRGCLFPFAEICEMISIPRPVSHARVAGEVECESIWPNDALHNLERRRDKRVQMRSGGGDFASFVSLFVIEWTSCSVDQMKMSAVKPSASVKTYGDPIQTSAGRGILVRKNSEITTACFQKRSHLYAGHRISS